MKTIYLLSFISIFIFASCNDQKTDENKLNTEIISNPISADNDGNIENLPVMTFEKTEFDFGAIMQGEKVSHTFKFKNTGKSDLLITSAKGSCGCTVPKYDTTPIAAGKSGEIEVVFDSDGRRGIQQKTVTVLANTQPNTVTLRFFADVIVPTEE
jgi:hypothetical protein